MINRASTYWWKLCSSLYYRFRFGRLGRGSWLRRPIAIINGRQIEIGEDCFIRDGARLEVVNRPGLPGGKLRIGNRVSIEQGAHIIACDDVVIEDDVCITPRCTIVDTTHSVGEATDGNRASVVDRGRAFVRIRRRAFLGANVVVLPNVTIGENSIIGANSVVTTDIPDDCVAVGAPARVVRRLR